jgi:hypothetical protein
MSDDPARERHILKLLVSRREVLCAGGAGFITALMAPLTASSQASRAHALGERLAIENLSTVRIGQLTGTAPEEPMRVDFQNWPLLQDTSNLGGRGHVNPQWGVLGVDLGANTEHDGKLFFFFGDVRSDKKQPDNADLVAWTDDTVILRHGGHFPLGWNFSLPNTQQGAPLTSGQPDWRLCIKCHELFWAPQGDASGSACPKDGGTHLPLGWTFVLPNKEQGAPLTSGQPNWSFCGKCHSLFYAPDVSSSVCPRDGGRHLPQGWDFVLPNDQQGATPATGQADWRYCANCKSLFWDGDAYKGVCSGAPGGGIILHPVLNNNGIFDPFVGEPPLGLTLSDETPNGAFSFNRQVYVFAGFPDPFYKILSNPPRSGDPGFGCFLYSKAFPENPSNPKQEVNPPNPYRKEFLLSPQRGWCPHDDRRDRLDPHDVLGLHFALPHDLPQSTTQQPNWRHCQKCETLFYDGFPGNRGACHKGGQHQPDAQGLNYTLPHDIPSDDGNQSSWRQCVKCLSLFFWDGHSPQGFCPAGGLHEAQTTANNYVLPNEYAEDDHNQSAWYLCGKCLGLFWSGNISAASVCPKGGGPHDRGDFNRPEFNYLLPHDINDDATRTKNFQFCGNCGGLFYNSGIFRSVCPKGGVHAPLGYNFALAHAGSQDSRHQASWRICEKCAGVFFDGLSQKGVCPKGGAHAATQGSRNFVLAHGPSGAVDTDWRYCTKCHGLVKVGQEVAFPFPSPVVIDNAEHRLLWSNSTQGQGLVILDYDFKNFRLAWMPLFHGRDPRYDSIRYYHRGKDVWSETVDSSPGYELFSHPTGKYTHVSALWLSDLQHWIVLYGTADADEPAPHFDNPIMARFSKNLRDWTDPVPLFKWQQPPGWAYGAFALQRFTSFDRASGLLTLTYLMSPSKPYQVQLMQTVASLPTMVTPRRLFYGGSGTARAGQPLPFMGVFYGVADNGDLRWYRYNGSGQPDPNGTLGWNANSGNAIGNGWDGLRFLRGGGDGIILSVARDGNLLWHRYLGAGENDASGSTGWHQNSSNPIGNGWREFVDLVVLPQTGDPSNHLKILAVKTDGTLLWYSYAGNGEADASGATGWHRNSGNPIGNGWQNFLHLHGSGNVVFAVKEDGTLLWFRYDGTGKADESGGTGWHPNSGNPIGNGWQGFRAIFGGVSDEGGVIGHVIYGVTEDGDVYWFRYEGNGEADKTGNTGWHPNSRTVIRRGWGALQRKSRKQRRRRRE